MNLRELNYILIPRSPEVLEQWADGRVAWPLRPLVWMTRHSTREGQIVFVLTLISAAAGVNIRFSHLYLIFCGLLGLWAAAFALRWVARIPHVRFSIEHPPRVEVEAPLTLTAVVRNEGSRPVYGLRISGPFLNWDGRWIGPRPVVDCLLPGETRRVQIQAQFSLRGPRSIGRFRVGSVRPLLLMSGPQKTSEPVRFTVVPPRPDFALPPPWAGQAQGGSWRALGLVGGASLQGVRPYRPGDRLRDLHARSWGRLGVPMVREYVVRSRPQVHIWVDPGLGGERGRRALMDAVAAAAHGVAVAMLGAGAEVIFAVVGEGGGRVVGPVAPRGAVEPILDVLATLGPPVSGGGAPPHLPGALGVVVIHPARCAPWVEAIAATAGLIDVEITEDRKATAVERRGQGRYAVPQGALGGRVILW